MTHTLLQQKPDQEEKRFIQNGKLYFDKKTERNFFFYLTLMMLLWGILVKLGLF